MAFSPGDREALLAVKGVGPTVTGMLLEGEFLGAMLFQRQRMVRRIYIVQALLAISGLIAWFVFNNAFGSILLIGGAGGGLIGEMITRRVILPLRLGRIYKQHADFKSPLTYSWDQEALTVEGELGSTRRPWHHYVKWQESDQSFLLYHSDVMFEIIPKRWFGSSRQYQEFREALVRIDINPS